MQKNNNQPLVGIFMPAYNQGNFVERAIESLKRQTYQNFIVHIVDDGSNDGVTPQKLKTIQYEKAKIFSNSTNRGVVFRFNQHFQKFKNSNYMMVLCADDALGPTFLEKTVAFLESNPQYGAVGTDIVLDFPNKKKSIIHKYDPEKTALPYMVARNNMLGSSLIRIKALNSTDLSGSFTIYQDWDRWISMLEAGWKLGIINEPLFHYFQNQKSLSHTISVQDEMNTRLKIMQKHSETYKKYYDLIIKELFHDLLITQEGKKWLDFQYDSLTSEVKRLNEIICQKNQIIQKQNNTPIKRIKNKVRSLIKKCLKK